jgi:hypothetical protein
MHLVPLCELIDHFDLVDSLNSVNTLMKAMYYCCYYYDYPRTYHYPLLTTLLQPLPPPTTANLAQVATAIAQRHGGETAPGIGEWRVPMHKLEQKELMSLSLSLSL